MKKEIKNITLPILYSKTEHVWHFFSIRTNKRNQRQKHLEKKDVPALIHFSIPQNKQKAYKYYNNLSFLITEKIHKEVLSFAISLGWKTQKRIKLLRF